MKKKIFVIAMLMVTALFWMPADNTVSAQNRQERRQDRGRDRRNDDYGQRRDGDRDRNKHGKWRKKNSYGYRNYGQYRRTQVGNRRYRLVRRNYRQNGMSLTRWVRLYY